MTDEPWKVSSHGAGRRHWHVSRRNGLEYAKDSRGRIRSFGSPDAAQRAADRLNLSEGIFVSAFEGVHERDGDLIRKRLLAGDRLCDIRELVPNVGRSRLRRMRDEVFAPLVTSPEVVKELARGPILNPGATVRYRHSRRAVRQAAARQVEMFPA